MKINNTRKIVKLHNCQISLLKSILNKNLYTTIIKINKTNIQPTKEIQNNNQNLLKISNFNFTKNNKNFENMKFEVYKTKDAEPTPKSISSHRTSRTTTEATKKKPQLQQQQQQQEIKSQTKTDLPNMKFKTSKISELNKHKKQTQSSNSTAGEIHKAAAAKKEPKLNPKKTINIDPENPNFSPFNNNNFISSEESSSSLNFQTAKTIIPLKSEKSNANNYKQSSSAEKEYPDILSQLSASEQEESHSREAFAEDENNENLNESEIEFLAHKDMQRFMTDESEGFPAAQADDSTIQERDLELLHLEFNVEKDSLTTSDQEDAMEKYNTLTDILNIYANDPLYKKTFDEAERVSICEMRTDVLFGVKCFLMLRNLSSLFILGHLVFQGFSLTWIFIYICSKYFLSKFTHEFHCSAIKILADPATMRLYVYSINLLGMEVCHSYSIFQVARSLTGYDFSAYEFHKEELVRKDFIVHKICKINNENFFKNTFLVLSRNYDNEFLFKYFTLMYSFTKMEINEIQEENPQQQENIFRLIVKEYFTNFPNYLPYLKEKLSKNLDYKLSEYDKRINIMSAWWFCGFLIFMFDYFIYKYLISVHYREVEGGIDKLYALEREKRLNKNGLAN